MKVEGLLLYIPCYYMLCFRQDEGTQVVSLHNCVFSGQQKVVHKFGLNLLNQVEHQREKFVSQILCFRIFQLIYFVFFSYSRSFLYY